MNNRNAWHPEDTVLADYLAKKLKRTLRNEIASHLASCPECLEKAVRAYETVKEAGNSNTPKKRKGSFMRNINIYLLLALAAFLLSFIIPRYFLQFLTATMLLGAKWVVDSKATRTLIMVREALKKGDEKEASRVLNARVRI